jgi:hypothetical protein
MSDSDDTPIRLFRLFLRAWKFILGNEANFRCYVRYYYSIYFKSNSKAKHKQLFCSTIHDLSSIFIDEADAESILHSVFTALLDFAIRVCNGDLEDSEENRAHIFNVLYCMMLSYLKEPKPFNVSSFYSKSV